jgi:hypothetical protein
MNTLTEVILESERMNEESQYDFETLGALALAKPAAESTKFDWRESTCTDGTKKFWSSGEGIFQIEKELEEGIKYPFRLIMHVVDDKSCSAGPFHSLATAQEAANRVWNFMLQSHIDHTQVSGGGYAPVMSHVMFPDL